MKKEQLKNRYLQGFGVAVIALALVRCAFPGIAGSSQPETLAAVDTTVVDTIVADNVAADTAQEETSPASEQPALAALPITASTKHPIYSVPNYREAFPDSNSLQLSAAQRWGVSPVKNRADAESRKRELVYMESSPYYYVAPLGASIPYLVPRAALLLHDIGQAFYDSLYVKGLPFHRLIVTSVLRSQEDVVRLRRYNGNATENSCHLYGTTFDIAYNRYKTVEAPDGPRRREVRNDTLKWVLSEVLRDMREQERCYIKYEVKQGCFHMTVR